MWHQVGRAVVGRLFVDVDEAAELWRRLSRAAPRADLVLMPNHFHLLADEPVELAPTMSAFARWRNRRRGEGGAVWAPRPPAEWVPDEQKRRRVRRYVWLNPCRARLVDDPLAWPWSTYRDAMDLGVAPGRPRVHEPARTHAWVAADDSVAAGSELPVRRLGSWSGTSGLAAVHDAVASLARCPPATLLQRGPARELLVAALRELVDAPVDDVARTAGVDPRTVRRLAGAHSGAVARVARVAGDPRFRLLTVGGPLRR
jgi:hypothetical protein